MYVIQGESRDIMCAIEKARRDVCNRGSVRVKRT